MHNFNALPTKKGDVLVSSAYAAGTTMVDFTQRDSRPREVGHLDPEGANTWSAYWYDGHIYTNDGGRGVDVIGVRDCATARHAPAAEFSNPQTQEIRARLAGEPGGGARRRPGPARLPGRRLDGLVEPDVEERVELLPAGALGERDEVGGRRVRRTCSCAYQPRRSAKKTSSPTFSRSACSVIAPRS